MIATVTGVSGSSLRTLLKQITPLLYVVTLATGLAVAANVQGTVSVKNSDVPVPGAQLVLESESSHQEATTDVQGHYVFSGLAPAADYRLVVAATGFQRMVYQSFAVDIAGAVGIRLYLEVIPQSEAVTVEAEIPPVRTDSPEISQTVDAERLASLPSNGRSATRFAMLDPHVRNTQGQGSDGNAASRLSFNGNSFRHTFHALDGASNYDSVFANAAQQTVSVSAIQELKILTNQYSAEYGNSSAGILAIVTRSGTDEFHGEAFGFLRPSGIQAAPPVSDRRLPNERLQAGTSAGGPVVRNRTQFFANFEDLQQSRLSPLLI